MKTTNEWPKLRDRRYKRLKWEGDSAKTEFGTYEIQRENHIHEGVIRTTMFRPLELRDSMLRLGILRWPSREDGDAAFRFLLYTRDLRQETLSWCRAEAQLHYEALQRQEATS